MELVVKDSRLRGMLMGSLFKGFPHVHNCKPYPFDFLGTEPFIEELQVPSERSVPPNQMGRLLSRSLTTIR